MPPDAPADELKRAYRRMALDAHPDRANGEADSMAAINEAWWVLGDPVRRADYDRSLQQPAPAPAPPPPPPAPEPPRHAGPFAHEDPLDPDEPRWVEHTAHLRRFRMLMTTVVVIMAVFFILVFAFIIWPATS